MREMVLNHASLLAPDGDRDTVSGWLRQLTAGMGQLVRNQVVERILRAHKDEWELLCLPNYSLAEAYQDLRRFGYREEYLFLVGLSTKAPLLHDVEKHIERNL